MHGKFDLKSKNLGPQIKLIRSLERVPAQEYTVQQNIIHCIYRYTRQSFSIYQKLKNNMHKVLEIINKISNKMYYIS